MAADEQVLLKFEHGVAVLTLNRPKDSNALSPETLELLATRLEELARDSSSFALLLRGEGQDFCVGRERPLAPPLERPRATAVRAELEVLKRMYSGLTAFPGVSLAAVQGRAIGAGCGLAGRCDLVIAAQDARLGFPEMLADLPPTLAISYMGKLLPRKRIFELVVTGREVSAQEAHEMGLVNRVVDPAQLMASAQELLSQLAQRDPASLRTVKAFFRKLDHMDTEVAADYGLNILATELSSRG